MKTKLNKVFAYLDKQKKEMIELQKGLTALPAFAPESGGDGESAKANFLLQALKQMGLGEATVYAAEDKRVASKQRPNLLLSFNGQNQDQTLLIMAHLDVVPPGDLKQWLTPPFKLVQKGDKLYGRGTEDNQQSLVSSVFALKAILACGLQPAFNVKLLFVADEETGSKFGIQYLLKRKPYLFKGNLQALVPDSGEPDSSLIEIAEKNILWLKFTTLGKQVHASTPHLGKNAFLAGSCLVLELEKLKNEFNKTDKLFAPPYSTFCPTKKEANVPNINTIPGSDIFYLDCRILPSEDLNLILKRIKTICKKIEKDYGVKINFEIIQKEVSPPSSPNSNLVEKLRHAIAQVYGRKAQTGGIGGGTVAAYLRRVGIQTVVWSTTERSLHMPNEYCRITNMLGDAKVMASLILEA